MDMEAWLQRISERHEALAQTVEHLAIQGEEQNKRIDKILAAQEKDEVRIRQMLTTLEQDSKDVRALGRIAEGTN